MPDNDFKKLLKLAMLSDTIYINGNNNNNNDYITDQIIYLRLPFINDKSSNKMKREIRKAHILIQIRPVFITEPPLATYL